MFYLLEDNRIIDSENLPKNWEIFSISFNRMYVEIFEDIIITQTFDIKKQSQNVFDLIENGDLIKSYRYESRDESDGYDINNVDRVDKGGAGILIAGFNVFVSNDDILAIYKPDSEGNYIKVWEKKDESN